MDINSLLKEQERILQVNNVPSNVLRKKYLLGKDYRSHQHSSNNNGGKGRAARRTPGWRKHAHGPANVPR